MPKNKKSKPLRNPSVMERTESYGNIELRYKNGELDDLAVVDDQGKCIFRMEWQHDNAYWLALYGNKKEINIYFNSDTKIKFKVVK